MTGINRFSKLGIHVLPVFVIGSLIILNISLNLSVPAISNDDSDSSTPGQSNFASNSNKNLTCVNPWEPAIFNAPTTGKNEIISLSTVCNHALGLGVYKDSVLNIQLRGPPLSVSFFG